MSFCLASPEEFLLGEEAGHRYHQKGEDQASYYSPERRSDADGVQPYSDSAHGQDRSCQEVCDSVGKHRVLAAAAKTASLDLPLELQGKDECARKGGHTCCRDHV